MNPTTSYDILEMAPHIFLSCLRPTRVRSIREQRALLYHGPNTSMAKFEQSNSCKSQIETRIVKIECPAAQEGMETAAEQLFRFTSFSSRSRCGHFSVPRKAHPNWREHRKDVRPTPYRPTASFGARDHKRTQAQMHAEPGRDLVPSLVGVRACMGLRMDRTEATMRNLDHGLRPWSI